MLADSHPRAEEGRAGMMKEINVGPETPAPPPPPPTPNPQPSFQPVLHEAAGGRGRLDVM